MKWGIVSPNSRHFQKKMQYAFEGRNCRFASRTPGPVSLGQKVVHGLTYEELLASDVDCVYICTPTATHGELVASAINAGKHILVEKMAGTTAAHRVQVSRAERAGVLLEVAFQPWFSPGFLRALDYYRGCQGPSPLRGEAVFHLPLAGSHPDPIHDVAFYPLMVAGCLSRGAVRSLSFDRVGSFELAELVFDDTIWSLSFSVDAEWCQRIRLGGSPASAEFEATGCFTGGPEDPMYRRVVDYFEEAAAGVGSQRKGLSSRTAVGQLARMLPVFDLWGEVYATRDKKDRV